MKENRCTWNHAITWSSSVLELIFSLYIISTQIVNNTETCSDRNSLTAVIYPLISWTVCWHICCIEPCSPVPLLLLWDLLQCSNERCCSFQRCFQKDAGKHCAVQVKDLPHLLWGPLIWHMFGHISTAGYWNDPSCFIVSHSGAVGVLLL